MPADHGGQWPFGKWNLYDAGIRTPLIISWKGHIKPQTRTEAMVSWIDIFPTILDIVEADVPKGLDGNSFANVLFGESNHHRDYIFTTHTNDGRMNVYPIRSIRGEKYKYILNQLPYCYHGNHSDILRKDGAGAYWNSWDSLAKINSAAEAIICKYYIRPKEEFYDLQNDPLEQHNLIDNAQYHKEISNMRNLLNEWLKEQGDKLKLSQEPWLLYEDRPSKDDFSK